MTNLPAKIVAVPVIRPEREKVKTTLFWDMHSGGWTTVEPFDKIYVECPEKLAVIYFRENIESPYAVDCNCCGPNYSIDEDSDIEQSSGYHRDADHVGYDDQGVRWQRKSRYDYNNYVSSDGRTGGYKNDWKWTYEGGQDLAEYLNGERVLFIPAATVAAWFTENPEFANEARLEN